MRWSLCLLTVVFGHDQYQHHQHQQSDKDILRRHGDYFLRLGNEGGKLVMDEGDIVKQPEQYRRSKRIAHPKQYKNYLQEARQFDYMQNAVNVDTLTDDMLPSQSQTEFVGIQGILETGDLSAAPSPQDLALAPISSQDLALAQMYQRDSSLCLQKYLCEIAGTSPDNLLMEEAALLAMVRSQEEITALLRSELTGPAAGSRPRRSTVDVDAALVEAERVGQVCSRQFPSCSVSRIDILRVYKDQKDTFCNMPMPYGL